MAESELIPCFNRLMAGKLKDTDRWCSLCFNVARYSCQRWQKHKGEDEIQVKGCGLHLCDYCFEGRKACGQSTNRFMEILFSKERDTTKYPNDPRPDAELLRRDGLLLRNLARLDIISNKNDAKGD
jgi:hypothetical protein